MMQLVIKQGDYLHFSLAGSGTGSNTEALLKVDRLEFKCHFTHKMWIKVIPSI